MLLQSMHNFNFRISIALYVKHLFNSIVKDFITIRPNSSTPRYIAKTIQNTSSKKLVRECSWQHFYINHKVETAQMSAS